jgi:hypothetical protein
MSKLKYSINFDLASHFDITKAINAQVFPLLAQAVNQVGQVTAIKWQDAVYHAKLWEGERDAYMQSISWDYKPGDLSGTLVATYKYAEQIETGRPARDLKKMLDTSTKVRRTKDGRRFLVIPFRHNTPGNDALAKSMPPSVYAMAKAMQASTVTGAGYRPAGETTLLSPKFGMMPSAHQTPFLSNPGNKQHSMTAKLTYAWGDRLTNAALRQAGLNKNEAKRYAGMVKMNTSTPSGGKSSAYLTFRVMMEGSPKWIVPAQPGQFIAKKVVEEMQPKAEAAFVEAIKRTV